MTERLDAARERAAQHDLLGLDDKAETAENWRSHADGDHVPVSPHELLIQTIAEADRGLKLLRAELDYAITGKHRKVEPLATIDLIEINLKVMDELMKHVTDREVGDAGAHPGAGAGR